MAGLDFNNLASQLTAAFQAAGMGAGGAGGFQLPFGAAGVGDDDAGVASNGFEWLMSQPQAGAGGGEHLFSAVAQLLERMRTPTSREPESLPHVFQLPNSAWGWRGGRGGESPAGLCCSVLGLLLLPLALATPSVEHVFSFP